MNKVKTIANMSCSRLNDGTVLFSVEDDYSGDRILDLKIPLEKFALIITGMGGVKSLCDFYPDAQINKEREGQRVQCEKTKIFGAAGREAQKSMIKAHFKNTVEILDEGWKIFDDGMTSQQNKSMHEYIIVRYVEREKEDEQASTNVDR